MVNQLRCLDGTALGTNLKIAFLVSIPDQLMIGLVCYESANALAIRIEFMKNTLIYSLVLFCLCHFTANFAKAMCAEAFPTNSANIHSNYIFQNWLLDEGHVPRAENSVAFGSEGNIAVRVMEDNRLQIFDPLSGQTFKMETISNTISPNFKIAIANGGGYTALADSEQLYLINNLDDRPVMRSYRLPSHPSTNPVFSKDGKTIELGLENGTIITADISTPNVTIKRLFQDAIRSVALSDELNFSFVSFAQKFVGQGRIFNLNDTPPSILPAIGKTGDPEIRAAQFAPVYGIEKLFVLRAGDEPGDNRVEMWDPLDSTLEHVYVVGEKTSFLDVAPNSHPLHIAVATDQHKFMIINAANGVIQRFQTPEALGHIHGIKWINGKHNFIVAAQAGTVELTSTARD